MNNTAKIILGTILKFGIGFATIGISLWDLKLAEKRRKEAINKPSKISDEDKDDIAKRVAELIKPAPRKKAVVTEELVEATN